jgi:hypothetical protein
MVPGDGIGPNACRLDSTGWRLLRDLSTDFLTFPQIVWFPKPRFYWRLDLRAGSEVQCMTFRSFLRYKRLTTMIAPSVGGPLCAFARPQEEKSFA